MNENRLNFPEIQDAHLDQMIRLAFAQEAALCGAEAGTSACGGSCRGL